MKSSDPIFRKLSFMKKYVAYLKSLDPETLDLEYDYEKRSAVERNFQLAIESAIDLGEIIISQEGFERPADYKSVFLVLGKHSILPKGFAEKFAPVAGFKQDLSDMLGVKVDLVMKNALKPRIGERILEEVVQV